MGKVKEQGRERAKNGKGKGKRQGKGEEWMGEGKYDEEGKYEDKVRQGPGKDMVKELTMDRERTRT